MVGTGLPLDGVRVVEMTHMVMGPTCGMILAQLGAEVIKVEPPAGDKTRSLGGMGTSFFPLFNRGKRSVVLDFAKTEDRATMDRLLASADVFLENFRDGQFVVWLAGVGPAVLFLVLEKMRRTRETPMRVIMITANEGGRHKAYAEMLDFDFYTSNGHGGQKKFVENYWANIQNSAAAAAVTSSSQKN
jgi:hypothetical protein